MKKIILLLIVFFCFPIFSVVFSQPIHIDDSLPITGTFVTPDLFYKSESEYRSFFQELKDADINLIVLGGTSNLTKDCATGDFDEQIDYRLYAGVPPFIPTAIKLAKEFNIKVYLGVANYKFPTPCFVFFNGTIGNENTDKGRLIAFSLRTIDAIKTMMPQTGVSWSDPIIAGFYIVPEGDTNIISDINHPQFIFYKEFSNVIKQKEPSKKILLSPFQRESATYQRSLDAYKNLFGQTKIDIIAPQDSMGSGVTSTFAASADHFRALHDAVALSPGKEAWANIETFTWTTAGTRTMVPGSIDHIKQQIDVAKPYVTRMITWIYQYTMLINPLSDNMAVQNPNAVRYTPDQAILRAKLRTDYLAAYGGSSSTPTPDQQLTIPPSQLTNPPQQPTNQPQPQDLGPRYAACDLCGYCPPNDPPQSWEKCQQCLYPSISSDPSTMESLIIDPETNLPPSSATGRQYTFFGCLGGGDAGGGFTEEGAAGGVIQSLLNIVFSMAGGIAFLYLLYGAFTIATSQANPERLNYGRRVVYGAIAGLIFTLGSVFIVKFIASGILKVPGF